MATLGNPGNTIEILQKYQFHFRKNLTELRKKWPRAHFWPVKVATNFVIFNRKNRKIRESVLSNSPFFFYQILINFLYSILQYPPQFLSIYAYKA